MKATFPAIGLLAFNIFVESTTASCGHGTSLLKRQVLISKRENGVEVAKTVQTANFGYIGTTGPTGWAALAADNTGCSTSTTQSPIDITGTSASTVAPGTLQMNFPAVASAEFENIGSTIEVVMEGKNASTTVNGKQFDLKQFHIHTPSEHTLNGQYFPLEMHMVHQAADGSIAVIATLFQLSETGQTTSLLTEATANIANIATPGAVTQTGPLNFENFVSAINAQSLSTYTGSLTTPPCAEGLSFFVTSQPLPLDVATYNKVKGVVGFNARFAQNAPGQENLLSAAARQIQSGQAPIVAPPVANVTAPVVAPAQPVVVTPPVASTPAAAHPAAPIAAPAAPVAKTPGNVQVIGGNGQVTPEMARLIKEQTGVDVPVSAKKSKRTIRAFKA